MGQFRTFLKGILVLVASLLMATANAEANAPAPPSFFLDNVLRSSQPIGQRPGCSISGVRDNAVRSSDFVDGDGGVYGRRLPESTAHSQRSPSV